MKKSIQSQSSLIHKSKLFIQNSKRIKLWNHKIDKNSVRPGQKLLGVCPKNIQLDQASVNKVTNWL